MLTSHRHSGDKSCWWSRWTGICKGMHQAVLPEPSRHHLGRYLPNGVRVRVRKKKEWLKRKDASGQLSNQSRMKLNKKEYLKTIEINTILKNTFSNHFNFLIINQIWVIAFPILTWSRFYFNFKCVAIFMLI